MRDERREPGAVALDEGDRLGELVAVAHARAEDVELLLGEAADPQRDVVGAHADDDDAPGRGGHVDGRADRGRARRSRRHDRRAAVARPLAGEADDLVVVGPRDRLGARARGRGRAGARARSTSSTRRAALARGDARSPGRSGRRRARRPARRASIRAAVHGADGDRHRLGEGGDLGRSSAIGKTCVGGHRQALLEAAVGVDADEAEAVAHVAAADAARVAVAAGRERPQGDPDAGAQRRRRSPGRRRRSSPRPRGPGRAAAIAPTASCSSPAKKWKSDPQIPTASGPDDDLAVARRARLGHVVAELHRARGVGDGGAHLVVPAARLTSRSRMRRALSA